MTADEALAVLQDAGELDPSCAEALAHLRSGLQHARVLAQITTDRTAVVASRRLAARRFTDWDEGRRA